MYCEVDRVFGGKGLDLSADKESQGNGDALSRFFCNLVFIK